MKTFVASYESMKKAKALAASKGVPTDGNFLDDILNDMGRCNAVREFSTKNAAIAWLKAEIKGLKSVFGCGDVHEIEWVPFAERCSACTCHGQRTVHTYTVSDDGIEDEHSVDDCYFEEVLS